MPAETRQSHVETNDPKTATLTVSLDESTGVTVSPLLTGKFCEHLARNIYNGMYAQILWNPTFADIPLGGGGQHPDGGPRLTDDTSAFERAVRKHRDRIGLPDADQLLDAHTDGLAFNWLKEGDRERVRVSPDAAPQGARAQRVEVLTAGEGIAQWAWLPLHRVRKYTWRMQVRSNNLQSLRLVVAPQNRPADKVEVKVSGVTRKWNCIEGSFKIPDDCPAEAPYRVSLTAPGKGQFVISRFLIYPADHVKGSDPDVTRLLKESRLSLLRWPGGNFVSDYHWEDGVGPMDVRPVRPNRIWGREEPNLFGTDEFMLFCREVGCEPMICLNAGTGTPAEAARWVEYCNGGADTPQGARRAANGHPEPWNVKYWEIGNELTGRHQKNWTTPAGYADRFREFAEAVRDADPSIRLYACGAPVLWNEANWKGSYKPTPVSWDGDVDWDWNKRLFVENADILTATTDHILEGGRIPASSDPLDVCCDFMAFPAVLEKKYVELESDMKRAGIDEPRLAITELQLFGNVKNSPSESDGPLNRETLVTPATMAEAVYDTLFYHMSARLSPFVELITHSATVNHGGGLRKERERVYPNPCYYARSLFAKVVGGEVMALELSCGTQATPRILGRLKDHAEALPVLDALAVRNAGGAIVLSIVNRNPRQGVDLTVSLGDRALDGEGQTTVLAADQPWSANTLENPECVVPRTSSVQVAQGRLELKMPPCSVVQVKLKG